MHIDVVQNIKSEINTWSCSIQLYDKDKNKILHTNGKGMSEEFSLASGYAELYERFCNLKSTIINDFIIKNNKLFTKKQNNNNNQYDLQHETLSTLLTKDNNFKEYYLNDYHTVDNLEVQKYFNNILNYNYTSTAFTSIIDNNKKYYYNSTLLSMFKGSGGLVAGNSLEEALNQGISELLEHYVTGQTFLFDQNFIFYNIDIAYIKDPSIQNIINILQKKYEIYLIDFSYNFNMPVIMLLLIDKKNHRFYINFGCFPIFEIAVERVFTEMYQGTETFSDSLDYPILIPSKHNPILFNQLESLNDITRYEALNEKIILNKKCIVEPNKDVYLFSSEKNYSNIDILNYYKNLCLKLNIDFAYLDNSQIPDMFALQIYGVNLPHYPFMQESKQLLLNNKDVYKYLNYMHEFEYKFLIQHIYDHNLFNEANKIRNDFTSEEEYLYQRHLGDAYFSFDRDNTFETLLHIIYSAPTFPEQAILELSKNTILEQDIKDYLTIYRYAISPQYSSTEKLNILSCLFNKNFISEDLELILDREYFIKNAILEPIYNYYHSDKYDNYLNAFI